MQKKQVIAGLLAGATIVSASAWWLGSSSPNAVEFAELASSPLAGTSSLVTTPLPVVDADGLTGFDSVEQGIIRNMRQTWPDGIKGVAPQVKAISGLMEQLRQMYPDDWQKRLLRILAAAFPAQAEELRNRYDAVLAYQDWMEHILPQMTFASGQERKQTIWDKRLSLFGQSAYEIWSTEHNADQVAVTLEELGASAEPMNQKVDTYVAALRKAYGDAATAPGAAHVTQSMMQFLEVDGIQKDLHNLPVEQRRDELRHLRTAMGLDAEAIKRWDALDQERDVSRATGMTYLDERARLEASFQGPERDQKIAAMQIRLFGEEQAQIIRNEESSGYYRFKAPQKFGVD